MPRPWTVVERIDTAEGLLELRQRDVRDFLITIDNRVLMNSLAHRSELVLGDLACQRIKERPQPSVVIGGLGMGFTLRGALDALPDPAQVRVLELNPVVERWCRGPISHLSDAALDDPRVDMVLGDVSQYLLAAPPQSLDAIILDLYEGPNRATHAQKDPFYGQRALSAFARALKPAGVLAVWSEQTDRGFEQRLEKASFTVERLRPGRGGLRHAVYLAQRSLR